MADPTNPKAKREIVEKQVVYWSRKFYEREKAVKKSFLDFIDKVQQSPANFKLTSLQTKSFKKYFHKDVLNTDTGELINSSNINTLLDEEKIQAALNKWTIDKLPGDYYRFNYIDDPDLKLILDSFNISIQKNFTAEQN